MDFKSPYNRNQHIDFFKNQFLPEDFIDHDEKIPVSFSPQFIKNVIKIGEAPSLDLNVYEIEHLSENDPRVSLSRESFRLLAQYGVKKALVLFISKKSLNYRLSLITIDLKWEEGHRAQKEYSNPRRYSFFLGPDTRAHTPEEYLVKKGRVKDFEDLKNRFSIEVVNKDFYTQIAVCFTELAGGKREIGRKSIDAGNGYLKLPSTSDDTLRKEFTVRLIGRLVFCWFLKKKHSEKGLSLLPEELLSCEAIEKNKGYYHNILEPLFFEVLNKLVKDRQKKYQTSIWSNIPFLNGGLFTPHPRDFYESGLTGVSKYLNVLKVPDEWLKELFQIFETYNFTIDENTSIDVELSIEPEMLGRIFENLLAEINPETGETARKATGSYYTPRPIVEYMVDESLKQYLLTKTKLDEGQIRSLLTYEDAEIKLSNSEKESVLNALDSIKIIDPACGSGAFPMGILQKMLLMLQKIDPESEWWLDKKLSQIESKLLKKELGKKLKAENVNYVHKLGIIQSSIYGVDIQPIAVEISKLRFFLSLIVDEKVNDSKENRGIEPLPNLEFKFVCANSLIGLPSLLHKSELKGKFEKVGTQRTMFDAVNEIDELKDLRDDYLRSYGEEKKKIENKFQEVQGRMFKHSLAWGGKDSQTLKLAQWNPFSEDACSWFDPEWMFGVKDGFDIVIANPPYISYYSRQAQKIDKREYAYYLEHYEFLKNTKKKSINSAMLFLEKAINILSERRTFVYIIDIGFFEKVYKEIRNFISEFTVLEIVTDISAFEGVASGQLIIFVKKERSSFQCAIKRDFRKINKSLSQEEFRGDTINISFEENTFKHLRSTISLGDICDITCGLEYGALRDFFLSREKKSEKYHKVINGGFSIPQRYCLRWDKDKNGYVLFDKEFEEKLVKKHLNISKTKKIVHFISGDENKYREEKLLIRQSALEIIAAHDGQSYYALRSIFLCNQKDKNYDLKYILALLNSKFITVYSRLNGIIRYVKGKQPQIRVDGLKKIPIKISSNQNELVRAVNKILSITKDTDYLENFAKQAKVKEYERQIDQMVYDLYGLTKKEIEIVEGKE